MRLLYQIAAVIIIIAMLAGCVAKAPDQNTGVGTPVVPSKPVSINGAGATFPLPVYTEWIYAYQYVDPLATINYTGTGSGGGKKGIVDNTIDFAGSDSLLKADEYAAGEDLQMFPMLAGAVVLIYNIEGLSAADPVLILDRESLVNLYAGRITRWNDPALTAINPGLASKLPDAPITAVHRSDGSGTTEIFTKALSAFSDDWKSSVGAGSAVEWPVDKTGNGIGGKGNAGVAAAVQNTPNAIGYVELSYAAANQIAYARLINLAGTIVDANADTLAAAMTDFAGAFTPQLTVDIVNAPGANSWPVAGYTYIILHTRNMADCEKAQRMLEFFRWALTDEGASRRAAELGYSTLPDEVRTVVLGKLSEVTCNGNPVLQ